ncbi:hypothetical protein Bca101_101509 [Brassica carinata]
MNALTNQSKGTSRKGIRSKRLPSIDTPVSTSIDSHSKPKLSLITKKNMSIDYGFLTPDEFGIFWDSDGHARAMDGRILQVSREDITYILQVANGADNLFMQQRSIPDNIPDNIPATSHIPAEPESLAEKKDEWEIAYIKTGINDVYNPLKNNMDWLRTRIDLLQQDLDTIRKKDPQPATSIDIFTITSIDSKFTAMEDRLQTYEDMHDRFTSPIMRYLDIFMHERSNRKE